MLAKLLTERQRRHGAMVSTPRKYTGSIPQSGATRSSTPPAAMGHLRAGSRDPEQRGQAFLQGATDLPRTRARRRTGPAEEVEALAERRAQAREAQAARQRRTYQRVDHRPTMSTSGSRLGRSPNSSASRGQRSRAASIAAPFPATRTADGSGYGGILLEQVEAARLVAEDAPAVVRALQATFYICGRAGLARDTGRGSPPCLRLVQTSGGPSTGRTPYRRLIARSCPTWTSSREPGSRVAHWERRRGRRECRGCWCRSHHAWVAS